MSLTSLFKSVFLLFYFIAAVKSSKQYTYTMISAPTGCPTPSATRALNAIPVSASSDGPQFTAYAKNSGQVIQQVLVPDQSNSQITFQTKNRSQIVLQLPGKQKAIVDNRGATIFLPNCSQALQLPVPNLVNIVKKMNPGRRKRPSPTFPLEFEDPVRAIVERDQAMGSVDVTVTYVDQCGNPVLDHSAYIDCDSMNPNTVYDSNTEVSMISDSNGNYYGTCTYPDTQADQKSCADTLKNILDYPTTGLLGQLTNLQGDLKVIGKLITRGYVADGLAALATALNFEAVAVAIGALGLYQGIIASGADDPISQYVCSQFSEIDLEVEARLDTESSGQQIAYQTAEPFTSITTTRFVSLSTVTCATFTGIPTGSCGMPLC